MLYTLWKDFHKKTLYEVRWEEIIWKSCTKLPLGLQVFKMLLLRNWAAQNDRKYGIFSKRKNLERKKWNVWLKHYFDMTSMYMECWDLLPKTTVGLLQATDSFRDVHRQPKTSKVLLSEDQFVFQSKMTWTGAAGRNRVLDDTYKDAAGAVLPSLCQPCAVEEDTHLGLRGPLKLVLGGRGKKKKKKEGWDSSVWRGKAEGQNQVVQDHSGVAWDARRIHSSNPTIMGMQWN